LVHADHQEYSAWMKQHEATLANSKQQIASLALLINAQRAKLQEQIDAGADEEADESVLTLKRVILKAEVELESHESLRRQCDVVYLFGDLHGIKASLISFFKKHESTGVLSILRYFFEAKTIEKIAKVSHGYIGFDLECVADFVHAFIAEADRAVGFERAAEECALALLTQEADEVDEQIVNARALQQTTSPNPIIKVVNYICQGTAKVAVTRRMPAGEGASWLLSTDEELQTARGQLLVRAHMASGQGNVDEAAACQRRADAMLAPDNYLDVLLAEKASVLQSLQTTRMRHAQLTASLESAMEQFAVENVNFKLLHEAAMRDGLALLAWQQALEDGDEDLLLGGMKEFDANFFITGQHGYQAATQQQKRTRQLLPPAARQLIRTNVSLRLPGSKGAAAFDGAHELGNKTIKSIVKKVEEELIARRIDHLEFSQACVEGLRINLNLGTPTDAPEHAKGMDSADSDAFNAVGVHRRMQASRDECVAGMRAIIRGKLMERLRDPNLLSTPYDLYDPKQPQLRQDVNERREVAISRRADFIKVRTLNAHIGGRYTEPYAKQAPRFGVLSATVLKRKPTAATLQRKLQGMTDAYAIASDVGTFVKGPRCFASMDAATGTWEKREQQKSLLRPWLRRTFKLQEAWGWTQQSLSALEGGGVAFLCKKKLTKVKPIETVHDGLASWRTFKLSASARALMKFGEDMCFEFIQQICVRRDFQQRGRQRSSIHWDVPGLLAKEALNRLRSAALGVTDLKVVVEPGKRLSGQALDPQKVIQSRAYGRPGMLRCFASLVAGVTRCRLLPLIPSGCELRWYGAQPDDPQSCFTEQALTHICSAEAAPTLRLGTPRTLLHYEADTSVVFRAFEVARAGEAVEVIGRDIDILLILILTYALETYSTDPHRHPAGLIFLRWSCQTMTADGDKYDPKKHSSDANWYPEELCNIRETTEAMLEHPVLAKLKPLQAVATLIYVIILLGGDTTCYFYGLPHSTSLDHMLEYAEFIELDSVLQVSALPSTRDCRRCLWALECECFY